MTSAKPESITAAWARQSPPARSCDHPGCSEGGLFRAPRTPDVLDSYYWFCLDHIRSYNKAWNFFAGMSQEEIENYQHADLTGHRPTWRFGVDRQLTHRTRHLVPHVLGREGDVALRGEHHGHL